MSVITQKQLKKLYLVEKKSSNEISRQLKCSVNKIDYWLKKYKIPKRSISEGVYLKHNAKGDPFLFKKPLNMEEAFLYGLGIGLYCGEGTKRNKNSVRLGNTDPNLVVKFIEFLQKIYSVEHSKLHFGLQIFSDMDSDLALQFWMKKLNARENQFQKVIVTPARGMGTYRYKTQHGVLIVYCHNTKLRDIICSTIENIPKIQ